MPYIPPAQQHLEAERLGQDFALTVASLSVVVGNVVFFLRHGVFPLPAAAPTGQETN